MRERVEVWVDDERIAAGPARVGELALSAGRGREVTRFRYDLGWLAQEADGWAIDPELPLGEGEFFPGGQRALHGALRDTAPDRWGRRLMDRREQEEASREGRRARALTEWDYMLGVQDAGRMGALRLREPEEGRWLDDRAPGIPPITRLRELEAAARQVDAELRRSRGSVAEPRGCGRGGARLGTALPASALQRARRQP